MDSRSSRSPDWEHQNTFVDRSIDGKHISSDPMIGKDGIIREAVNHVVETVLKILNHIVR